MKEVETVIYKCDFCRKYLLRKNAMIRHESICFKNPNRQPQEGEFFLWENIPSGLTVENSYGVPGSTWLEPITEALPPRSKEVLEVLDKFKWVPLDEHGCIKLGMVYHMGEWVEIEGYEPPTFAPGRSWRDEKIK